MWWIYTKTYLLKSVIRSANGFSQAYIFIILMPVITSFMVLILTSVNVAVLLLRGQMWEMSHGDHCQLPSSAEGTGRDQGSKGSLQLFCTENRGRSYSKHKWGKDFN